MNHAENIEWCALKRQQEILADISWNAAHFFRTLSDVTQGALLDYVEGSRGLVDRFVAWAGEFDAFWEALPAEDPRTEEYIGEVDIFATLKFRALLKEMTALYATKEEVAPAVKDVKSYQILPAYEDGAEVITQPEGPTEDTGYFGVYACDSNGFATWVLDADTLDTALLVTKTLCNAAGATLEPLLWVK